MSARADIGAVILAGGRGRRMDGADKGLLALRGRPLIRHVIERVQPQVGELVISANRHLADYRALGCRVVEDRWPDFRGPLAGVASALAATSAPSLLIVPCDMPALPADLAARLAAALRTADAAAVACGADRMQPLCALMRRTLAPALDAYLDGGGAKAAEWWRAQRAVPVHFAEHAAFANLNTPEEWAVAERGE